MADSRPPTRRSQHWSPADWVALVTVTAGAGLLRFYRLTQPDIQARVFKAMGISDEEAQAKFGFLMGAFRYGAPPHGGFAVGMERLIAILAGEDNIREVIAFPKTQSGLDPMSGAPGQVDPKQIDELGIRVLPPKKA